MSVQYTFLIENKNNGAQVLIYVELSENGTGSGYMQGPKYTYTHLDY